MMNDMVSVVDVAAYIELSSMAEYYSSLQP